jgi:hypothetical protein
VSELYDVTGAVSRTWVKKWGTEVGVLLRIAADPQCLGEVSGTVEELAGNFGLDGWSLRLALERLEERGCIGRNVSQGERGGTYRVRPIAEWTGAPWKAGHARALEELDIDYGRRARVLSRWQTSELRAPAREVARSQQTAHRRATWGLRAHTREVGDEATRGLRARGAAPSPPPVVGAVATAPPPVVKRRAGGDFVGLEDFGERESELVRAFMAGALLEELYGHALRRLCRVAAESNGNFPAVLELARRPDGPERWLDRLAELERAMVGPPVARSAIRELSERERLERHRDELRRAGLEEDAREVETQLASL